MEKVSRFLLLSMMTYDAILKCANSQAQYLNGTHDHKRFVLSSPSVCVFMCTVWAARGGDVDGDKCQWNPLTQTHTLAKAIIAFDITYFVLLSCLI